MRLDQTETDLNVCLLSYWYKIAAQSAKQIAVAVKSIVTVLGKGAKEADQFCKNDIKL
jgi:hypothetical protein